MARKIRAKITSIFLALIMALTMMPVTAMADGNASPPEPYKYEESILFGGLQLEFNYWDEEYLNAVNRVTVDGEEYESADPYSWSLNDYEYKIAASSYFIQLGIPSLNEREDHTLIVSADGYENLNLKLSYNGNSWSGEAAEQQIVPDTDVDIDSVPESEPEIKNPPVPSGCAANFGYDFKITFDSFEWISAITAVTVAEESYTVGSSSSLVWNNTSYYADAANNCIYIGEGGNFIDGKALCVISAEGYKDLTLELDKNGHSAVTAESGSEVETAPADPPAAEKKTAPGAAFYVPVGFMDNYYVQFEIDDKDYVSGVTGIAVNGTEWMEQTSKMGLSGKQYYLDKDAALISFNNMPCPLNSGDIITITNPSYEDLRLKVTIAGGIVTVTPADENTEQGDEYKLHVRLTGSFESAVVGQKGYDAVSSASTNININKNSNVSVEAALTKKDREPAVSDWNLLDTNNDIRIYADKTVVNIDSASGMEGFYSPYDGSLTLSGTPEKAGTYPISITITDDQGRTAMSNELIFRVYSGDEYLEDQLILENCIQTSDGKYMYDMEPWAIKNFDNNDNIVTVPADVKAWYGSHTSGTYGELGYAITFGSPAVQTLIVPADCDLTMVNMDILSSVRIVVQNGGKLTLRDTSVQGIVEVENGGTFSMNYDSYADEFLMGSSINGQLILQDGATVDNAIIYSNTNYIANGNEARCNSNPVVAVNGDVTIKGNVIIRGDEAPTGGNGQSGLAVNGGTVTVPEGSILAVYGGGYSALTKDGGDAIILNNGAVAGDGKLIAVGGWSADVIGGGSGGNAVSGTGIISAANAYLQGGSVYNGTVGEPVTDSVNISDNTNRNLVEGKVGPIDYNDSTYWHGATLDSIPDLNKNYPVENNASGSESEIPTEPESKTVIIDGKEIENPENILNENGEYDLSNSNAFSGGAEDAYLVTAGDEIQLIGDTSLKRWVGTWQSWEKFIYPAEAMSAQYPYLEQAWEQAYTAYIATFAAAGIDMSAMMPDTAALKAYWAGIATTKGVDSMTVASDENGSYVITWLDADGNTLSSDTYKMTGKLLKGFEGAPAYVFTADTLDEDSPYKYFISMVPGMDGTEETPIAAHFHFQFGNSLEEMLLKGELYNSSDYGTGANGRPISSNLANSQWYATMTDANADPLADYNVILGMHMADKWTELPEDNADGNIEDSGDSTDSSTGDNMGGNVEDNTGDNTVGNTDSSSNGSSSGGSGGSTGSSSGNTSGNSVGSSNSSLNSGSNQSNMNNNGGSDENRTDITDDDTPLSDLPSFTDVASDAYYADAVAWAVQNNITSGVDVATFGPDQICTRAQTVTFLYRLMKGNAEATAAFSDVVPDKYYASAVTWAVGNGITNGTSAVTFSPDLTVTRAQVVTFLYRAAGSPAAFGENPFRDVADSAYYHDAVLWAVQNGITTGTSDAVFSPDDLCTRAQVVTFLYRYMNLS